jgi:hypothetical protein
LGAGARGCCHGHRCDALCGSFHKEEIEKEFGIQLTTEDDKNDKNSVWNYIDRRNAEEKTNL